MSAFMYTHHQQQQHHAHHGAHMPSNNHHGRSRRAPKMAAQNAQRQFRGVKSMRELAEAPAVTAFRARFEAGRSFDLDDDLEFCPNLLTDEDCFSVALHPLRWFRSFFPVQRLSRYFPLQHQIQPVQQVTPAISLSPASANSYVHGVANPNHLNYQQQPANRTRKVIPIINPTTGMSLASPPSSISPAMMQAAQRRW
ncbi:hypothetical protein N7454_002445 [Penicillium verhagenii]|nr:hypothetical protein N7454_002445 [Penicillium verhagenii]